MATRTWEVRLLAGNNGVVQMNVEADEYRAEDKGVTFVRATNDDWNAVAFFPLSTSVSALLSVKDVTP